MAEGNEFVMSYDRLRGVRVVGWWEPGDPRLHYRVEQEIPEGLLSHNLHLQSENKKGERGENTPGHGRFFTGTSGSQSEFLRTVGAVFVGSATPAASITR